MSGKNSKSMSMDPNKKPDYDQIFRDLKDDDNFILSEFQLDQLDPLSPDTIALTSDILLSSSSQDSLESESLDKDLPCALVFGVSKETRKEPRVTPRKKKSSNGDKFPANPNNNNSSEADNDSRVMTVVVSTNKVSNLTQIVINTGKEEQVYQGKTSELLQATGNLPLPAGLDAPNGSYNKGQDLVISEALAELGITDDALQPSNVTDHGKVWHCPRDDCARKFTRLYALKCHLLTHYGVRPFKCDFQGCAWSFFSEFKLKRHKETHLKKKDYVCKIAGCERQFTTIYNLWSHEKLHSRPSKIVCHVPGCEDKFQTKRALELHMKTHDQSHAPYVCKHEGCDKRYYSNNALTSHQRCHSYKDTDIKCSWPGCNKVFDKPCRLKAHVRSHTGCKPYTCNFQDCQWAFSSSSKLKRHQKKHTNDRKFVCDLASCGKAFMRSEHLKEHKLTHNEGRFFRCDLCDSKFSAKSSLYVHIKKHHKKEPSYKNEANALKSHNQISLEPKAEGTDYVFYADKMIMLAPCETVILNEKEAEGSEKESSLQENVIDQGSARTRLTRYDVSKMKTGANEVQTEVQDDILNPDISEGLLFTEDLSSIYYHDAMDNNECQVLLLDSNAEGVISLKDFN